MTLTVRLVATLLVLGGLAGCGAAGTDGTAPAAAVAPPVAEASAAPTVDTAQSDLKAPRHYIRNPLAQRRVRHRHAGPR